jgi:AAA+ ATPase superfamily predicted ATPase
MKQFFDRGRIRELQSLEELYERNEFAFAVIYGRRRIGKTSLVGEFVRRGNKKAIRFTATENTDIMNRESFSQSIFAFSGMSLSAIHPAFPSACEFAETVIVAVPAIPLDIFS